jgi:cholesterol oxidase
MAGLAEEKTYQYLSRPIEELISGQHAEKKEHSSVPSQDQLCGSGYVDCPTTEPNVAICDVLIVGSGYGGSVAAHVLSGTYDKTANRVLRVMMVERGREFATGEFPESLGDLPGEVRYHRDDHDDYKNEFIGDPDALFDFRINKDVSALVANGLGGGSLINANVALRPNRDGFENRRWPGKLRYLENLEQHFQAVETILGVECRPKADTLPAKYRAFSILANSVGANAKPAPLTVDHSKCTNCGNCITGCNVGAKKTLPLTALCEATKKGLEIYTGASVLTVHRCPDDQAWTVRLRRTATSKNPLMIEVFRIRAKLVILAAGTLGSTEILLRSKCNKPNPLPTSDQVGKGFSSNGGMIAFGYAGANPVLPIGKPSSEKHRDPGPTITGYAYASMFGSGKPPLVLQDAAVPIGLKHIFEEVITTASLGARYVNYREPEWFKKMRKQKLDLDPLIVHNGAIEHSQVILAIGQDSAKGCITLSKPKSPAPNQMLSETLDDTHALISWNDAAKDPVFDAINTKLLEAYAKRGGFLKDRDTMLEGGFDGGEYLPDPAWKAIPDKIARYIEGGAPKGKILTVHPLGGCAMADSASDGVVNEWGQVFKGDNRNSFYDDLFVMDGAVLPEALGINPFLTIAAIAHRNSSAIKEKINKETIKFETDSNSSKIAFCKKFDTCKIVVPKPRDTSARDNQPIKIEIHEQLARMPIPIPDLDEVHYKKLISLANEKAKKQHEERNDPNTFKDPFQVERYYRLVVKIKVLLDLNDYLKNPDTNPLKGETSLFLDAKYSVDKKAPSRPENDKDFSSHLLFVEPVELENLVKVAQGTCSVKLLVRDAPKSGAKMKRFWEIAASASKKRSKDFSHGKFISRANELYLTALQHTHFRRFEYNLDFDSKGIDPNQLERFITDQLGGQFKLSGKKDIAYTADNPWDALLRMSLDFHAKGNTKPLGCFHVDVNHLLKDGIPQVVESPHMPATLMGMARLGMFALRALIQTHLWSFAAPDYKRHEFAKQIPPEAITLKDEKIIPQVIPRTDPKLDEPPNESPKTHVDGLVPYINLARYASKKTEKKSKQEQKHLLLIHGLAHGGAVFTTSTIDTPMAKYFVEQDYVVWVLDHRLSPALAWQPHRRKVTMDHIGKVDIPLAVEHIYQISGKPIDVFAHCIGAGGFAIATLSGCLYDPGKGRSKINRAAIHAVTPWLIPSAKNRANAKLAAFYKDALRFDDPSEAGFDPIPPAKNTIPEFSDVLIDRVAGSIPWPFNESHLRQGLDHKDHMSQSVCDRMTLWYSHEWNHSNLCQKTKDQIGTLVGFGNLEVFRHIYFCILRERLTDREGQNVYVVKENIKKYWTFPTVFIHGNDNQVFTPEGSRISAWKLNKVMELLGEGDKKYKKPDVWHCEVHGYGHMDLLFGTEADKHVYPHINSFFLDTLTDKNNQASTSANPEVGNVSIQKQNSCSELKYLRSTELLSGPRYSVYEPVSGTNKVKIQVWQEPSAWSTDVPFESVYEFLDDAGKTLPHALEDHKLIPSKYGKYWIDTFTVDVNAKPGKVSLPNVKIPKSPVPQSVVIIASSKIFNTLAASVLATISNSTSKNLSNGTAKQSTKKSMPMSFVLGSCRYPGSPFERDNSDRIFAAILGQAMENQSSNPIDFAIFLGDQIYSDATANVFDTTEIVERYWERYRAALGTKNSPNMNKMLKKLPTYFSVDDHEFDDAWVGSESTDPTVEREKSIQYERALDAGLNYQGMVGSGAKVRLWHDFKPLDYPFFVMDTRTGRKIRWAQTAPEHASITDTDQWSALTAWLHNLKNSNYGGPIFIACGSPLAPPLKETVRFPESWRNDDGWLGFPGSLGLLIDLICDGGIENVVLLGGDLHLSAAARMTFKKKGKKDVVVHQIIASGLYAPLPFANVKPEEIAEEVDYPIPGRKDCAIRFEKHLVLTTSQSHFLRIDVRPNDPKNANCANHEILITPYDNKGTKLRTPICLTSI